MEPAIIISLILGGASVISSICFGIMPAIRKNKIEILRNKVRLLAKDIKFFYRLEILYIDELSNKTGQNKETLKKKIRSIVSGELGYKLSDYTKPSQTQKIIDQYGTIQ